MRNSAWVFSGVVLSFLVYGFLDAAEAGAKSPPNPAAASRAKAATAEAHAADAKADNAKRTVVELNASIRAAQQKVAESKTGLKKIEDALIDSQPADSEFGKARAAYQNALKKYQAASDDTEAKQAYEAAKAVYDPLRKKLLEGNSEWVTTNQDLLDKQRLLDDLNRRYGQASAVSRDAAAAAQKAERAAAAAAQVPPPPPPKAQHKPKKGNNHKGGQKRHR